MKGVPLENCPSEFFPIVDGINHCYWTGFVLEKSTGTREGIGVFIFNIRNNLHGILFIVVYAIVVAWMSHEEGIFFKVSSIELGVKR
ncbi:hypothetical protein ES703_106969 [subsurface metagenome]